ncbi:hypothetical protein C2G38_2177351 [Gigaspora rosea]|uniref:Uncharacterized protein n=1 Tax=Gigaspora rosea TaxID=44941 RepID=A0A397VHA5_9GLOM|nr:hypothetical protein C2G38_2177351 [Gigaspora rosea]
MDDNTDATLPLHVPLTTETVIKTSSNRLSMGENEDKDKIQDDDLNGSIYILFKNYCEMLLDLQLWKCFKENADLGNLSAKYWKGYYLYNGYDGVVEKDQTSAMELFKEAHCLAMLRWSVVNFEFSLKAGWKSKPKVISISTPRVALKLLTEVFKEHPDDELRSVATILQLLRTKSQIYTNDYNIATIFHFLFANYSKNYYDIDILTASSAIMAVV